MENRVIENENNMVKRKMKLNIKGRFQKFWNRVLLTPRLKAIGVDVHELKEHNPHHVEVIMSGYKNKLWNAVRLAKNNAPFIELNEMTVEFVDVEPCSANL
jgi:hypothetical protein